MNSFIQCSIRNTLVKNTPEECIRQQTLQLLYDKGFPKSLISVEISLKEVSMDKQNIPPNRRIDILTSYVNQNEILPLVLIECKSIKISYLHISQLTTYNYWIKSPFVAIANPDGIYLFQCNKEKLLPIENINWNYNSLLSLRKEIKS